MQKKLPKTRMKKVIIVDDDLSILEATKIILEDEGYRVFTATDRIGIKRLIQTSPPDLILLDIWLQGDNGGDIARELKNMQSTKDIPIVMISANNDIENIAVASGANSYLAKPFSIDALVRVIEKFTGDGSLHQ